MPPPREHTAELGLVAGSVNVLKHVASGRCPLGGAAKRAFTRALPFGKSSPDVPPEPLREQSVAITTLLRFLHAMEQSMVDARLPLLQESRSGRRKSVKCLTNSKHAEPNSSLLSVCETEPSAGDWRREGT